MSWKKSLAVSISVLGLVLSEQVIQACADYNHYDTYPQFFGTKAPDKEAYTPFKFIEGELYYTDDYWNTETNENGQENTLTVNERINRNLMLKEWQSFFSNNLSVSEIAAVLFYEDENIYQTIIDEKPLSDGLQDSKFVQLLRSKKQKNVLDYLAYSKKCETISLDGNEDWNNGKAAAKAKNSKSDLKAAGIIAFKKEKNDFLKMKYAFQIMRMAFYDNQSDEVLAFFDEQLKGKADKSIAYTRILGFKAGAHFRKNEKAKAGYFYSKMFDNSDAYKYNAMLSFEWSRKQVGEDNYTIVKDRIDEIFALCLTDHEKAVVLVMKALRAYPGFALDDIKKAYALDPKVDGIDVLVNREINKLESNYFRKLVYQQNKLPNSSRWYYTIRSLDYTQNVEEKNFEIENANYVNALNQFTDQLIADKKSGSPALWYLTKAYLACMQNNANEMNKQLTSAKQSGMKASEQTLYNTIDLLYSLYKSQQITPAIEAEILPKLKALDALATKNTLATYQFRDIMNHLVAGKYFQQGDTIKGVYAMGHAQTWDSKREKFDADADFQDMQGEVLNRMSIAKLKEVQAFRQSPAKNPFENWLVEKTYYTYDVLRELEATKYMRDNDFKNAIAIFEQEGLAKDTFANPFMPQINDYIETYPDDFKRTFTKLSYSKRMVELQEIIAKNPNDAGALYGFALALYNTSYYGKSGNMLLYNRSSTDELGYFKDESDKSLPRFLQEYYRVYSAEQYFNKAAVTTKDPELKAKALWGAAKCWTKRSPSSSEYRGYYFDKAYYQNALKNPYFQKIDAGLINTKYMQTVSGTCEYYSDYLNRKG